MNDKELRLEALRAALNINSVCARPYDRVGDLIMHTQEIFEFVKTGVRLKHEDITDQSLQGGS